jgi:hypothetical protein
LLFDKSFLQSLSVDEAAMLDQFYRALVTPVFFTETLADLAKPENRGRSPESIVGGLAERTPVCQGAANASHWALAIDDMMGNHYPLDGRPVVAGGIPVEVRGKKGLVYEKSPEREAFDRWQRGQFASVERDFAARWRRSLASVNLAEIARAFKAQLHDAVRPKSLEQAKGLASRLLAGEMNFPSFQLAFSIFDVGRTNALQIVRRWKADGRRPLAEFAPFAAHCVEVDLFFYLAMSNGLISDQRPSNLMDMAYFYYLPFAEIFVSSDKLHRAVAPMFLKPSQLFVWGQDLKADLRLADEYFSALPEEEKAQGLFLLASAPPEACERIASHWDQFLPGLRKREKEHRIPRPKSADEREIIARGNAFIEAAAARRIASAPKGEPDHLVIERAIPITRGKWRMFSKEVEDENDKAERQRRTPRS